MTPAKSYPMPQDNGVNVRDTPPDILDPERDDQVGDVTTGPLPVTRVETHDVEVNWSLARRPEGARCIHITGPSTLTYAEAELLIADLTNAFGPIKELRTLRSFDD